MKIKLLTAALAALLIFPAFGTVVYAGGSSAEEPEETPVVETTPEPNPFTPPGTGTVIDHATDADGNEFYTIMTPDENVFYLVIDRQRETENVYFLNAVTEQDLMALAEKSENTGNGGTSAIPDPAPTPEPTPQPEPEPMTEPEPEKGGNMGMMIVVALVILAGGGAGYYFKIYKPKQEQADMGDEFDEYQPDDYEDEDVPLPGDDDAPPWDDEDELDIEDDDFSGDDEA